MSKKKMGNPTEEEIEFMRSFENSAGVGFVGRNFTIITRAIFYLERPNWKSASEWPYITIEAVRLFELLSLGLNELSQIFVEKPQEYYAVPKTIRKKQPVAHSYESLGCCRVWDNEGWCELSRLLGKNILFVHIHTL